MNAKALEFLIWLKMIIYAVTFVNILKKWRFFTLFGKYLSPRKPIDY